MPFHTAPEERLYLTRIQQARDRLRKRYIIDSIPLAATVAMDASRESISCCVMSDVKKCVLLQMCDGACDDDR